MIRPVRFAGLAAVVALLVTAVVVVTRGGDGPPPATEATIAIHFSKFSQGRLTVPAGTPVTIVIENQDPIEHEWIVGDAATHARHRTGTEPYHDGVPTEVSLRPFESKTTAVVFDQPGDYSFVCHLPGHEAYGMKGTVRVVAAG